MPYDYAAAQRRAAAIITRRGSKCKLRRNGSDRDCIAVKTRYPPRAIDGDLIQRDDEQVFIAAQGLAVAPDAELDTFIDAKGEEWIIKHVGKLEPTDVVVYWNLQVRGQ